MITTSDARAFTAPGSTEAVATVNGGSCGDSSPCPGGVSQAPRATLVLTPEPKRVHMGTSALTTNRRGVDSKERSSVGSATGERGHAGRKDATPGSWQIRKASVAGIKPGRRLVVSAALVALSLLPPSSVLGANTDVFTATNHVTLTSDRHLANLPKADAGPSLLLPLAIYGAGNFGDGWSTSLALKAGAREMNPHGQMSGSRLALKVGSTLALTAGDAWLQKRDKKLAWALRVAATAGYGYLTLRNVQNAKTQGGIR